MIIGIASGLLISSSADAQMGPGENGAWQFQDAYSRQVNINSAIMQEQRRAGVYSSPVYNTTNTTNIAGDVYNCSVSAAASANTGQTQASGNSGAPSVLNSPALDVAATGSTAATSAGAALNSLGVGIGTDQANVGSQQSAAMVDPYAGGVSGIIGGTSSVLEQTTNTFQSALNSPQFASIYDSAACQSSSGHGGRGR